MEACGQRGSQSLVSKENGDSEWLKWSERKVIELRRVEIEELSTWGGAGLPSCQAKSGEKGWLLTKAPFKRSLSTVCSRAL